MALITITGFPCSGKSTRAAQLKSNFEARLADPDYTGPSLKVVIVNDESSHVSRSVYDDSISEKSGRANLFTGVTRALGQGSIVICDSLNYIKGFRYQMYCAAREARIRVCTIHVAVPPEKCQEWHDAQTEECSYQQATFDNLLMRYEEPSSMVRWDSPLFTLPFDEDAPYDDIWNVITKGEKKPPPAAVVQIRKPPPNTLQTLTNTTSLIITSLLSHINSAPTMTDTFRIPSPPASTSTSTASSLVLHLPMKRVTLPEMQRLKRQFEGVQTKAQASGSRAAGTWSEEDVAVSFVRFLEATWDTN
ncbi:chromatin associated protein KTI12 [Naematelia encephala]|uniref:Chromatin associated protein KTI12 n=1 Tax=Naematelia encephala TaxID=71784 RepID=A0A1Y2BHU7_9TREE|nr:chromatin associated protein KTI12 [Naematelia encephala]